MEKLSIGLVGVGKLGQFHCNALSQMPQVNLVGVHDTDATTRSEVAERFHCRDFATLDELIAAVDAVGVIVPTTEHLSVARQALEAGKPVFVEKPIAGSVEEAQELVDLAAAKQLTLQVGHIERFNPAIRALQGKGDDFVTKHSRKSLRILGTRSGAQHTYGERIELQAVVEGPLDVVEWSVTASGATLAEARARLAAADEALASAGAEVVQADIDVIRQWILDGVP